MKDETNITNAQEALELTMKNGAEFERLLNSINMQASCGQTCIRLFDVYVSPDCMRQILKAGFYISETTGMMGERVQIISWAI
jgi:hypothetical protein